MRVPLAGGAATTVVAFANSFGPPTGIAVAPELNTIAYSFNGADSGGTVRHGLGRAELDGSNPKVGVCVCARVCCVAGWRVWVVVGAGPAARGANVRVMCEAVVSLTLWVLVFVCLRFWPFAEHVPVFLQHQGDIGHLVRRKDHGHSVR